MKLINDTEYEKVLSSQSLLERVYDQIRLVDPVSKRVLYSRSNRKSCGARCFEFWGKGQMCDNCQSMRAFTKGTESFKLESAGDRVYTMAAIPVESDGGRFIVEMIKDVTQSILEMTGTIEAVKKFVEETNSLLLRDSLTGAYNIDYFKERLTGCFTAGSESPAKTLILIKIENLIQLNQKYGNRTGDFVLAQISGIIRDTLLPADTLIRYREDEFLIMLPGSDSGSAEQKLQKICESTKQLLFLTKYGNTHIRVNAGLAYTEEHSSLSLDECLSLARMDMKKRKIR